MRSTLSSTSRAWGSSSTTSTRTPVRSGAQPPLALERAFGGRGGALALLDLEAHAEIAGERASGGAWRAALEHPAIGAVVAAHAVFDLVGRAGVVGAQACVEPAREILRVHDARPTVPVRVLRAVA